MVHLSYLSTTSGRAVSRKWSALSLPDMLLISRRSPVQSGALPPKLPAQFASQHRVISELHSSKVGAQLRRRDRRDPVKILGGSKRQDIVFAYTRDNSYFAHHLYQGESQWLCRSRPTVFHGLLIFLHLTITRILSVSHWQPCIFTSSWL